jgi:hypothetical protein
MIMRRLLRSIARGEEIAEDVSTLENPAILGHGHAAQAMVGINDGAGFPHSG